MSIEAPLIELSKEQIINLGIEWGVDYKKTWTCYEGKEYACGKCPACSSRIKGFLDAKKIDPIKYGVIVPWKQYDCKEI